MFSSHWYLSSCPSGGGKISPVFLAFHDGMQFLASFFFKVGHEREDFWAWRRHTEGKREKRRKQEFQSHSWHFLCLFGGKTSLFYACITSWMCDRKRQMTWGQAGFFFFIHLLHSFSARPHHHTSVSVVKTLIKVQNLCIIQYKCGWSAV